MAKVVIHLMLKTNGSNQVNRHVLPLYELVILVIRKIGGKTGKAQLFVQVIFFALDGCCSAVGVKAVLLNMRLFDFLQTCPLFQT